MAKYSSNWLSMVLAIEFIAYTCDGIRNWIFLFEFNSNILLEKSGGFVFANPIVIFPSARDGWIFFVYFYYNVLPFRFLYRQSAYLVDLNIEYSWRKELSEVLFLFIKSIHIYNKSNI